jgi:hypothetical protein
MEFTTAGRLLSEAFCVFISGVVRFGQLAVTHYYIIQRLYMPYRNGCIIAPLVSPALLI